jgi:hypothetical protein
VKEEHSRVLGFGGETAGDSQGLDRVEIRSQVKSAWGRATSPVTSKYRCSNSFTMTLMGGR